MAKWIPEGLFGSIRRECLDHMIIVHETDLRATLQSHIHYHNTQRTHLGIGNDSPTLREVQADEEIGIVAVANGVHHLCFRKAG